MSPVYAVPVMRWKMAATYDANHHQTVQRTNVCGIIRNVHIIWARGALSAQTNKFTVKWNTGKSSRNVVTETNNICRRLMWTALISPPVLQTNPTFIFIGSRLIILLALKINQRRFAFAFTLVSADGLRMKQSKWVVQSSASAIGRSAGAPGDARRETWDGPPGNFN